MKSRIFVLAGLALITSVFTSIADAAFVGTSLQLLNGWIAAPLATGNPSVSVDEDIVRFSGAIAGGSTAQPFVLPANYRPETDAYVPVNLCSARKGRLWIQASGTVTVQAASASLADAQCFTSLDGAEFVRKGTSFTDLTLQNNWIGGPFQTSGPAAREVLGIVYLKGAISSGTAPLAFNLPPAFRPNGEVNLPIDICSGRKGRLRIEPTGDAFVTPDADTGGDVACFTSLDGVSFPHHSKFQVVKPINGWAAGSSGTRPPYSQVVGDVVHLSGSISTSGGNMTAFVMEEHFLPASDVYLDVDLCNGGMGRLWIQSNGVATVQPDNGATGIADAKCATSLEGLTYRISGQRPLALLNGWTGGPFSTSKPSATWTNDDRRRWNWLGGTVNLRGAVAGGTDPEIMVLPRMMWPVLETLVEVDLCNAHKGRLRIATDGTVTVEAPDFTDAQCFVSLDGVSFVPGFGKGFFQMTNDWSNNVPGYPNELIAKNDANVIHLEVQASGGSAPVITSSLADDTISGTGRYYPVGGDTVSPAMLCNFAQGRIRVHPVSDTVAEVSVEGIDGDFADAQCGTVLEGVQYTIDELTPLVLKHGWVGGAQSTRLPGAKNVDGVVHLSGGMSGGTGSPFTLPPAMRPLADVYVTVTLCNAHPGRLHILPTGVTTVEATDGDRASLECFTGLDGVSFVP